MLVCEENFVSSLLTYNSVEKRIILIWFALKTFPRKNVLCLYTRSLIWYGFLARLLKIKSSNSCVEGR